MKKFLLIFVVFPVLLITCKQEENLAVAFYNTENFFDTADDPHKNDNEFLPGSEKHWTEERYRKKLDDVARVLSEIDTVSFPVFIGLCEIENRKVLDDLISTPELAPERYSVAHFESPDIRGIDVALLYRSDFFRLAHAEAIPIKFPDNPRYKTRDILHVSGKIGKEEFHVFVNHWPSRIGGDEKTEPERVFVASVLKQKVEEVLASRPDANIIIMGDMNDEPANKSLFETLDARAPGSGSELVNLMYPLDQQNEGTYYFRGQWNMLDNLVVSASLLDGKGYEAVGAKGFVFRKNWMEFKNKNGMLLPNRTYGGSNYYGGVSDHFPVYFMLKKQ